MLKQITSPEVAVPLLLAAVVGAVLVVADAPIWTAYAAVVVLGIVYGVLLARRLRREHRRERAPGDLARAGTSR